MGKCEMCGREARLHTHHVIPRWCGGLEGDTMEVCGSCHGRLERKFETFIKWGSFHWKYWENPDKKRRACLQYVKKWRCRKTLHSFSPIPYLSIRTRLDYNKKTGNFVISTGRSYAPNRKFAPQKYLYSFSPIPNVRVSTILYCNMKTNHISIYNTYYGHDHKKYRCKKFLFSFMPVSRVQIRVDCEYQFRTEHIGIYTQHLYLGKKKVQQPHLLNVQRHKIEVEQRSRRGS